MASKLVVQLDRWFARTVSAVIVKSAEMADVVKPVEAYVVPNGVDMNEFRPIDLHKAREGIGMVRRYSLHSLSRQSCQPAQGYGLAELATSQAAARVEQQLRLIPLQMLPGASTVLHECLRRDVDDFVD